MVYVYIFLPLVFIGLLVFNTVKGNRQLKKVKEFAAKEQAAKIILWANLEKIDGNKVDYTFSYWKKLKNETTQSNSDVVILLLKKGTYNFEISEKSDNSINKTTTKVDIDAGRTYELTYNKNSSTYLRLYSGDESTEL